MIHILPDDLTEIRHAGSMSVVVFAEGRSLRVTNLRQTCVHSCSPTSAQKGSFPCANRRAERHVQRNVEEGENIIDMVQRSPRTSTQRISPHLSFSRMTVWRTPHTEGIYPYHIQRIQHLEPADMCSRLILYRWVNYNPHTYSLHGAESFLRS